MDNHLPLLPEIWSNICSFLPKPSLSQLRLTCSKLNGIALPWTFKNILVEGYDDSVQRFLNIAKSPKLRVLVRELTIDTWVGPGFEYKCNQAYPFPVTFMSALPYVRFFEKVTAIHLRFNEIQIDERMVREMRMYHDAKLDYSDEDFGISQEQVLPLRELTISNLADFPEFNLYGSDAFERVISLPSLVDLRLYVATESNDAEPESAVHYLEKYEFFENLSSSWLSGEICQNLTTLSLFYRDYWGWFPKFDFRCIRGDPPLPQLKVLALGKYVFTHDWQIDWFSSIGQKNGSNGLEELYLDDCPILFEARQFGPFDARSPGYPNYYVITEVIYDPEEPEEHEYSLRWHHMLSQWSTSMKGLKVFKIGHGAWNGAPRDTVHAITQDAAFSGIGKNKLEHRLSDNLHRDFACPEPARDHHFKDNEAWAPARYLQGTGMSQLRASQMQYIVYDCDTGPSPWLATQRYRSMPTREPHEPEEGTRAKDYVAYEAFMSAIKARNNSWPLYLRDIVPFSVPSSVTNMTTFRTQLSELQASAKKYPSLPLLKIPQQGSSKTTWKDISFPTFQKHVELSARYWKDKFSKIGAKEKAIVGLWFKGYTYMDIIHTWGVARAGYTPQLFSLRMTDPSVIYQLLREAEAVALVYDPSYKSILENSPLPSYPGGDILSQEGYLEQLSLPALRKPSKAEDIMMIYHTSGSTSGTPKLVPITAKWLDHAFATCGDIWDTVQMSGTQRTGVAIKWELKPYRKQCGLLACLRQMIDEYGLTNLNMFPPFLSAVLRDARKDPSLLTSLKTLKLICYGGLALDHTDEAWARSQGLPLINVFASTEVGILLFSDPNENTGYFKLPPGRKYQFAPLKDDIGSGERLLELIVPPEASNCPHPSLWSADGKFHTGDLFVEVAPGRYVPKGRNDNWIKMETALRCDTGSIEANVMATCGNDLVSAVVVVGAGRPCPTVFVEPKNESVLDSDGNDPEGPVSKLKNEIFRRIAPFHKRRYMHERIDDPWYIIVVPQGTLPRTATKGNIRRKEVERVFQGELEALYAR
ncbi:hypothetical protein NM208_g3956 [Fusarium decemcellulare]|uniref:Uncharacterized protein n=1 Tax=Fusarium decemcellulare TaxID=57161 RepID=A0ACC1SM96_9HYPO|nr:hypothetical protein NM208_g3956 [Fusarium decemcellulare]